MILSICTFATLPTDPKSYSVTFFSLLTEFLGNLQLYLRQISV